MVVPSATPAATGARQVGELLPSFRLKATVGDDPLTEAKTCRLPQGQALDERVGLISRSESLRNTNRSLSLCLILALRTAKWPPRSDPLLSDRNMEEEIEFARLGEDTGKCRI